MANHMRFSNSEPNQVWKWDLHAIDVTRGSVLTSRFFFLAKSFWNQGMMFRELEKSSEISPHIHAYFI
jgi:hypothetical protein